MPGLNVHIDVCCTGQCHAVPLESTCRECCFRPVSEGLLLIERYVNISHVACLSNQQLIGSLTLEIAVKSS